jgi:TetR/AcrR family transcriptional regulator, repressor for uid operon
MSAENDELRARLIDAANEVFAERGYDGAGVHEIARRAGLTTGAIYSRFRGKNDLLLEAIDESVPAEIERLLSGQVEADAASIITQLGSHLVDDGWSSSVLLEAIVASRREDGLAERLSSRLDDDSRRLAKLIEEAKASGLVDPAYSTEAITTFCNAVSFGMLVTKALDRNLPDHDQWDQLIAGLVSALAKPPTRPSTEERQ